MTELICREIYRTVVIKDRDGVQHSVDAIDSQLRKIEGQSLGYKVARFFDLLGR